MGWELLSGGFNVPLCGRLSHLHGSTFRGHGGEPTDVAEVDGHQVERIRFHPFAPHQLVSYWPAPTSQNQPPADTKHIVTNISHNAHLHETVIVAFSLLNIDYEG